MKGFKRRGQIWVETVIYTLIALSMIGAVMAFALPKIQEIQDQATIEQSVVVIQDINNIILSVVQGGPGNKRLIETKIKTGSLNIVSDEDKIEFEIESSYLYSEPGRTISIGSIDTKTEVLGSIYRITLTAEYNHDIRYKGSDEVKIISASPTAYTISIENLGKNQTTGRTVIDINIV